MFRFAIQARVPGTLARAGMIETDHGIIKTPAFIPVSTKATLKSLTPEQLSELVGAESTLTNTYHLYLQPGTSVIEKAGGLHKFMNWPKPTFTDSGGFQAFSLGANHARRSKISKNKEEVLISKNQLDEKSEIIPLAKVDDEGVDFKSIIDGSAHRFTPEFSLDIQYAIGADIIFVLDECAPPDADYATQKRAIERTAKWAERSVLYHQKRQANKNVFLPALYGIVQGAKFQDLRKQSAQMIGGMDFAGFGIGGTFEKGDMATAVGWVCKELPEDKPRHLLGIGEPADLILGIENGADTFDCVAPTRIARNGSVYTREGGRINLLNAPFTTDFGPLDSRCNCYTCTHYTRAYLAHLFRAREMLAATLASIHNLYYVVNLVKEARQAIMDNKWQEFKKSLKFL